MSKKNSHFVNYHYIKNLIDNGYESDLFVFNFIDDTPNSTLVEITNKATKELSHARFGLSKNTKQRIFATLIGIDAIFLWNNYGKRTITDTIKVPFEDFEGSMKYQINDVKGSFDSFFAKD